MRIKSFFTAISLIFCLQYAAIAQESDEMFTIYLVRHAEKASSGENPKNPPLTECGELRAESIATFFDQVDLKEIYSTDYTRTKSTAEPTAMKKEKKMKYYDPNNLEDFSKLLIDSKQDALVVGHSNTTGVLAGLLAGEVLGSFDERIYNRIYQVVFYKNEGRLEVFHSAFICKN